FALGVVDGFMLSDMSIRAGIEAAFIGMQTAFAGHILDYDGSDGFLVGLLDVEGADFATALHERDDSALVGRAALAALEVGASTGGFGALFLLGAVIGLIGLDNLTLATERAKA